jgi:hypothetical protein
LFGPVFSVVSGGVGTLAVVGVIALVWPALAGLGPFDTLHPDEPATHAPSPAPDSSG